MSDQNQTDRQNVENTGHEWDGITELDTPMPRWWLFLFYASIAFGIIYIILMPAIPLVHTYTKGILKYSDRAAVLAKVDEKQVERSAQLGQLKGLSIDAIQADENLFRYAMAAGSSAFGDNCATCHGAGGQGFKGYPNLNDDIWLWGGTFEAIRHTITVGIRSTDPQTQTNNMDAYGRDELLTDAEINILVDYVLSLSGSVDGKLTAEGAELFATNCESCHGKDGIGDQSQGAPSFRDADWLYGGAPEEVHTTIYDGRNGVMPHWQTRLSEEMITALAVYVYSLGGGQETPTSQ